MIFKKNLAIISLIFIFFVSKISYSDDVFEKGKEIFLNDGNCASCHTLSDAKSIGVIGPSLDEIRPTLEVVLANVTNGIGVMPAYKDILSKEEIEAVSHYVSKASD
tara:strand:+ start:740 stop:1057 length:318 start_codon:yes stop_codon:yes gene_type:complete